MKKRGSLSLTSIEKRIKALMGKEDRQDVEFRCLIALTELGDVVKYLTHDPELNPNARPHGSKEDETLAYGQALVQTVALCYLRDIPLKKAFDLGLNNWEDADWRKVEAKQQNNVVGVTACHGYREGEAYVVSEKHKISGFRDGMILVCEFAKADITEYLEKSLAIVTDHGGKTCHAATIAREYNIPCVVGTGNATELIRTGDKIIVDGEKERGKIIFS